MIGDADFGTAAPERPALAVVPQREGAAPPAGLTEFFRFRFGSTATQQPDDPVFPLFIERLGDAPLDEVWYTGGQVTGGQWAGIRFVESGCYLAAHLRFDLSDAHRIDEVACQAYRRLLDLVRRRGYPNLLRVWNLFPGINAGDGDLERYRQFSLGRAHALDALGYRDRKLPAGTAIGTDPGTPLTVSLLAGALQSRAVENPRQTSAYRYPRQFGPRSPSFSRAVMLKLDGSHRLLISGTASIVGYESRHDSVERQIRETFCNIEALVAHAAAQANCAATGLIDGDACFRLYLRRREDLPAAEAALSTHFAARKQIVFLRGDICRRELMLEVEGACGF
ncbi:MAG: hypothetical protein ACREVN_05095 [Gammaproteobacteria bacterium]